MSLTAAAVVSESGAEEARLVDQFRRGDRRAFEALVRRHQQPVLAIAYRFTRDRATAEDLAQKAFLNALERIGELRGAFRPWVMRIAANLAKNYVRDHAKFVDAPDAQDDAPDHGAHDPAAGIDLARATALLRAAIARLPDRQREVVLLRVDGQLSFEEVGEALGITANNAKVNFHHAVKRLRALLGGTDVGI